MAEETFTAEDTVHAMLTTSHTMVVFRSHEAFPNERPPHALPGWKQIAGDQGTTLYVHQGREARDMDALARIPPMQRL